MNQSTGKRKGAWFWVGVTLLTLSALFWLILILTLIVGKTEEAVGVAGIITMLFAIPIGIGVYCVSRGRREIIEEETSNERTPFTKDTRAEIVIRVPSPFLGGGWFLLLFGMSCFLMAYMIEGRGPTLGFVGVGLFSVLSAIWFVGWTTKVTFNQPPGYISVTQGCIPIFLWFLRRKHVSREEPQSIRFVEAGETTPYTVRAYALKVTMKSGKKLTLFVWHRDESEHLLQRIVQFSPQVMLLPPIKAG